MTNKAVAICVSCVRGTRTFVGRYRNFLRNPGTLFTLASFILLIAAIIQDPAGLNEAAQAGRPLYFAAALLGSLYIWWSAIQGIREGDFTADIPVSLATIAAIAIGQYSAAAVVAVLLLVGGLQTAERRRDVVSYDRRVAAARRVVAAGLAAGQRIFYIASGVKDLDLAVKEDRALAPGADEALVLTDVPASFVLVPPALAAATAPLLALPPLPPSGAYRFGDARVVGLARREDNPSLDEVLRQFPDMRFFRLRPVASGQIIARDVTDETRRVLGGEGLDGERDGEQD